MNIERDKRYLTRNGSIVRVVCIDAPGPYPVISVDEDGDTSSHSKTGLCVDSSLCGDDIVAEHREPREWWAETQSGVLSQSRSKPAGGVWIRVREVMEDKA